MEKTITVGPDHPALPGHFPGDSIVPGVVLLDEVASAVEAMIVGRQITGLPAVKFLSPLRPGQECRLRLTPGRGDTVKFECSAGTRMVASGTLKLRPA